MLKPTFESLLTLAGHSFLARRFNEKAFEAPYHYHPELELTFIQKGEGRRYVGNNMSPFEAGDVVLLGAGLPHCWKLAEEVKHKKTASTVVLQFREDGFGDGFFQLNEMRSVSRLLQQSGAGIQFYGHTATAAANRLQYIERENHPLKKMIAFLELLQLLSESNELILLNKEGEAHLHSVDDQSRINKVMAYIVDHFRQQITLEKAAAIAGMTTTAFCKYFKRTTRKTFVETVTEFRISYAMQQLVNTDHPVSHICFESGFGDLSFFYKTFRQRIKMSPLQYRKKFRREAIFTEAGEASLEAEPKAAPVETALVVKTGLSLR